MHISSTINPLTKSNQDVPILVLTYQEIRKFILKPQTYAELSELTKEKFSTIAPDGVLSFYTSTLDICQGKAVQIDESTYSPLSIALDEITVTIDVASGRDDINNEHREQEHAASSTYTPTWKQAEVARRKTTPGSQPEGRGEDEIDNSQNENEVEHGTYDREGPKTHVHEERKQDGFPRALESDQEEEAEVFEAWGGIPVPDGPEEDDSTIQSQKMRNTGNRLRKSIASNHEKLPMISSQNDVDEIYPSHSRRLYKDDDRFNVTIFGPQPDQEAAFKTRGGHLIKKVLAGACKTFNIKPNGAELVLFVETEEESGIRNSGGMFICEGTSTIAKCGIDENSKLAIRIKHAYPESDYE